VLLSIFTVSLSLLLGTPAPARPRVAPTVASTVHAVSVATGATTAPTTEPSTEPTTGPTTAVTQVTFNEFLPEERGLGDCISAVPRPGCGSEARGGWRQTLVFVLILTGLGIIAWRIVASARAAKRQVG
jgi:hypothetical protein